MSSHYQHESADNEHHLPETKFCGYHYTIISSTISAMLLFVFAMGKMFKYARRCNCHPTSHRKALDYSAFLEQHKREEETDSSPYYTPQ